MAARAQGVFDPTTASAQKLLQLDPAGASANGVALNRPVPGAPMAQQHRHNLRVSPAHPLVARTSSSRKPLSEISDSKRSSKSL